MTAAEQAVNLDQIDDAIRQLTLKRDRLLFQGAPFGAPSTHIYVRVSTGRQLAEGASVETQIASCLAYAKRHGLPYLGNEERAIALARSISESGDAGTLRTIAAGLLAEQVYVEDESAWDSAIFSRPAGRKLYHAASHGDHVVCMHLDRMFRSVRDCLNTIDLLAGPDRDRPRVRLHVSDQLGAIDLSSQAGKAVIHMLAFAAQWQSDASSAKVRSTLASLRRHGIRDTAVPAIGWEFFRYRERRAIGQRPNPEMVETIRLMVHFRYANGWLPPKICRIISNRKSEMYRRYRKWRTKKTAGGIEIVEDEGRWNAARVNEIVLGGAHLGARMPAGKKHCRQLAVFHDGKAVPWPYIGYPDLQEAYLVRPIEELAKDYEDAKEIPAWAGAEA